MKLRGSYLTGIIGTGLAHLALIPILAFYGISICPVLRERGFGLGCAYNGAFVAWLVAANAIGTAVALRLGARKFSLAVLYGAIFAAGATWLRNYLISMHAPVPTIMRMGTALFYSAILLGVLHLVIMDWLLTVRAREERPSSASLELP